MVVHGANVQDRDGARLVLSRLLECAARLQLLWADGGYAGQLVAWVRETCGWTLEIVKRPTPQHRFEVLPHRWVVERTFAWLGRNRRLSKDYEASIASSEALVYVGMVRIMARRLAEADTS